MNKLLLSIAVISFTTVAAFATEPLILEPFGFNGYSQIQPQIMQSAQSALADSIGNETLTDANTNAINYNSNMIPQNNAAKGLPVEKHYRDGIIIETKQGSRTNTQWNPGGKGTKSYF